MPDTTTTTTAPKPAAEAKPKTVGGYQLGAKITLGKNAEGKTYDGGDNNPKRKGSKSFDKFAKYKDGMTVEQAAAAGVTGADLSWDTKHGFIKIG
jgi:hypothetical protein